MVQCAYCGNEGKYQLKNGKWCCSKHYQGCPSIRKKNSDTKKYHYMLPKINANKIRVTCSYCSKEVSLPGLKIHENYCYLNPLNVRFCPVCDSPIKNYRTSKTCGYSCSNIFYRRGVSKPNGKNGRPPSIRTICFSNHIKKCIICGEFRIVSVHHYDKNRDNNSPENLIPLCQTHHQYMHSRYRSLIEGKVKEYIQNFISNCQRGIKCTTTLTQIQHQEFLKE